VSRIVFSVDNRTPSHPEYDRADCEVPASIPQNAAVHKERVHRNLTSGAAMPPARNYEPAELFDQRDPATEGRWDLAANRRHRIPPRRPARSVPAP
jgi:hypothetical protein